jgi:adenylate kinase family enzyme
MIILLAGLLLVIRFGTGDLIKTIIVGAGYAENRRPFSHNFSHNSGNNGFLGMAQRISILGPPGSGKTTLAMQLALKYELPLYHLDKLFFLPNWHKPKLEAWYTINHEITENDTWILDGNYFDTINLRLLRSTEFVVVLLPPQIRLWRMLKRTFVNWGKIRPDMPLPDRINPSLWIKTIFFMKLRKKAFSDVTEFCRSNNIRCTVLTTDNEIKSFYEGHQFQFE